MKLKGPNRRAQERERAAAEAAAKARPSAPKPSAMRSQMPRRWLRSGTRGKPVGELLRFYPTIEAAIRVRV